MHQDRAAIPNVPIVFNELPRQDFELIIGDEKRRKIVMANR